MDLYFDCYLGQMLYLKMGSYMDLDLYCYLDINCYLITVLKMELYWDFYLDLNMGSNMD